MKTKTFAILFALVMVLSMAVGVFAQDFTETWDENTVLTVFNDLDMYFPDMFADEDSDFIWTDNGPADFPSEFPKSADAYTAKAPLDMAEDNKMDAIKKISQIVEDEERITVKKLQTKYPQGAERMLIYALTGRKVNSAMLPADAGCVVDNVDTVFAIQNAVINGIPLTRRIVTVTGDAIANPQNFWVPIGTNQRDLVDRAHHYSHLLDLP